MEKSPQALRTISEAAMVLGVATHVLRFWEARFPQIQPIKSTGGRRYYRPSDLHLLFGLKHLLHDEGLTIRGAQKILKHHGRDHLISIGRGTEIGKTLLDSGEAKGPDLTGADMKDPQRSPTAAQILAFPKENSAPSAQTVLDNKDQSDDGLTIDRAHLASTDILETILAHKIDPISSNPTGPLRGLRFHIDRSRTADQLGDTLGVLIPSSPDAATTPAASPHSPHEFQMHTQETESSFIPYQLTQPLQKGPAKKPLVDSCSLAARLRNLPKGRITSEENELVQLAEQLRNFRQKLENLSENIDTQRDTPNSPEIAAGSDAQVADF